MDATVRARFFKVSENPEDVDDFPDLLLSEGKKPLSEREKNVASDAGEEGAGPGIILRIEHCQTEGKFVVGQFCRKQTSNIPPQAGPDGLSPITLAEGQGLGHVAAFRFHRPTRILLLQNNIQCATPHRISIYLASINSALYGFSPVLREDALERFKHRKVRSFTVRFASPDNLEALDDRGIASAKGARLLAEAFNGLDVSITVGVGRTRKKFLDFGWVNKEVKALLGSDADITELEVSANEDEEGPNIDFIEEHLKCSQTLSLPEGDPEQHYKVRMAFLKSEFVARMDYLNKHFGPNSE